MEKKIQFIRLSGLIALVVLIGFACRLPLGANSSPETENLEATIAALQTQVADPTIPVPEPEAQPHAVEDGQPSPQPDEAVNATPRGFVVVSDNQFKAYDFDGNPLEMDFAAPQTYFGENETSVLPEAIYYTQYGGETNGVYRVDAADTRKLDFITSGNNPISIAVSPDANKIAWSSGNWVDLTLETRVFVADVDGSNPQMIAERVGDVEEQSWLIYHPLRWTQDGTLIYATGLTGIGGYMLFWGYNGMYQYDPASGTTNTLVSDDERLGLCLSSISNNLEMVSIVCRKGDAGVRVRQLSNGVETAFPLVEGQNVAGSAKFSTDDSWLAYVTQTQNFEDERGKVVVVPVDAIQTPRVVAEIEGGAFTVYGWLDADHFLVHRYDNVAQQGGIWIMSKDGSLVRELVAGNFVGFLP